MPRIRDYKAKILFSVSKTGKEMEKEEWDPCIFLLFC